MRTFQRPRPPKIPGPVRPRHEPPTIAEAVAAARDLTDDLRHQIEIAAGLMGVPEAEVEAAAIEAQKADRPTLRGSSVARSIVSSRPGAPRVVVVERRRARI